MDLAPTTPTTERELRTIFSVEIPVRLRHEVKVCASKAGMTLRAFVIQLFEAAVEQADG